MLKKNARNLLIDCCRDKNILLFLDFATLKVSRCVSCFIVARNQKRRKGNNFGRSGMDNCVDSGVLWARSHNHLGAVMQIAWARQKNVKIIRHFQTGRTEWLRNSLTIKTNFMGGFLRLFVAL